MERVDTQRQQPRRQRELELENNKKKPKKKAEARLVGTSGPHGLEHQRERWGGEEGKREVDGCLK